MSRAALSRSVVAVLLTSAAAACSKPAPATDSTTAPAAVSAPNAAPFDAKVEEAAIRTRDSLWLDASHKKDVAGVMATYADDAVTFYGGKQQNGRAEIQKDFETNVVNGPKDLVQSWATASIAFASSGDVAYETGTYDDASNGGKTHARGHFLTVWKKIGGEWKVVRDMTSPEAAAKP